MLSASDIAKTDRWLKTPKIVFKCSGCGPTYRESWQIRANGRILFASADQRETERIFDSIIDRIGRSFTGEIFQTAEGI